MNEKLHAQSPGEKPWMKHFGTLAQLRKENRRIEKIIEREFETIDPEPMRWSAELVDKRNSAH